MLCGPDGEAGEVPRHVKPSDLRSGDSIEYRGGRAVVLFTDPRTGDTCLKQGDYAAWVHLGDGTVKRLAREPKRCVFVDVDQATHEVRDIRWENE